MEKCNWTEFDIKLYWLGMRYGDYPGNIWGKILAENEAFTSVLDIGCGPGGFALYAVNSGFSVQAVDINKKFLELLKEEVDDRKLLQTYHSDWLDAEVESSDISICAYSLSENIRSPEGIKKILDKTERAAYFISYIDIVKNEFCADRLYDKLSVEPKKWKNSNEKFLDTLKTMSKSYTYEEIEYDFGIPFFNEIPLNMYIEFIAKKTDIYDYKIIEGHINSIKTVKNGVSWIPNLKKSFIAKVCV